MPNNISIFDDEQEHPEQEQLMLFVDGELSPRETRRCEVHLDACWSCRVRVAKIEEVIAHIIKYEETVTQFQSTRPTRGWGNFDSQLHVLANEMGRRSAILRFLDSCKQRLHFPRVQLWHPLAFSTVATLVIVAIIYQFVLVMPVSARDLIQRSIAAQNQQLKEATEPVLHQRIQVSRLVMSSSTAGGLTSGGDQLPPVTYEIWNDTVNGRVKSAPSAVAGGPVSSSDGIILSDLRSVLIANHMSDHQPLSAASFKAWSDQLTSKNEEVAKEQDALMIKTTTDAQPGQIAEARLTIRSDDYHPTALYINVNTGAGQSSFELIEQDYQIISLKDVDPAVFADAAKIEVAKSAPPANESLPPAVAGVDLSNTNANLSFANTSAPASTATEVEVLDLLHKVGADIAEQISVTRTADGWLLVEGLVETDKRKEEILSALAPVAGDPAIRIKIQTIEEATRALKQQKAQATPGTIERVDVDTNAMPADADLRAYFKDRGGDVDTEIRDFAARVTAHSRVAGLQASALNRMANRFTPVQLAALDPAARAKWLGILKGYAATVRRETAALRGELQPVFGGFDAGGAESVTSDAELISVARRLFDFAAANDRAVHVAFTASNSSGNTAAIRSAQFRRSLSEAEALAAAIERAK